MGVRIVGGVWARRRLEVPAGDRVRPTADRVRQSVFTAWAHLFPDARALDLFAGAGTLGIEALSRGARHVTFVERDPRVVTVLQKNLASLGEIPAAVVQTEIPRGLHRVGRGVPPFDLIFLDPPYANEGIADLVGNVTRAGLLADGGHVMVEHPTRRPLTLPRADLRTVDSRQFGDTTVTLFQYRGSAAPTTESSMPSPMRRAAVYPGSFDPLTNGHMDIIKRGLKAFDEIIVAVAVNVRKTALFSMQERVSLIRDAFADEPRVVVESFDGLLVHYMQRRGVRIVIRGLRAVSDFEYEFQMANVNRKLFPEMETLFMMTGEENFYVSSHVVREVAALGGQVSCLVPQVVEERLRRKLAECATNDAAACPSSSEDNP